MALVIAAIVALVYTVDARAHLLGQSGDTDANQQLPLVLLSGGGFYFDSLYPDGVHPNAMTLVRGHIVSAYPIVPGLLNTVTFAVAQHVDHARPLRDDATYLSLLTGSAVTAMSAGAVLLLLAGEGIARVPSVALSILYAFGTTAFSVASRGIWQHGPALLFLSVALLFLRCRASVPLAIAGLALGLAVETRFPVLVLVLPLFYVAWERGRRAFGAFVTLFLLPVALMRLYAWQVWGAAFAFVEYPAAGAARSFFGEDPFEGLAGVLFSPGRGILIYSPFLVLAVLGAVRAVRDRDSLGVTAGAGVVLYVVTVAAWTSWWGGKSFGYRMLTEVLPFLALLSAGPIVTWWCRGGLRCAAVVLTAGWGVLVNYAGARHYPQVPYRGMDEERRDAWSLREGELAGCLAALSVRIAHHGLRVGVDDTRVRDAP